MAELFWAYWILFLQEHRLGIFKILFPEQMDGMSISFLLIMKTSPVSRQWCSSHLWFSYVYRALSNVKDHPDSSVHHYAPHLLFTVSGMKPLKLSSVSSRWLQCQNSSTAFPKLSARGISSAVSILTYEPLLFIPTTKRALTWQCLTIWQYRIYTVVLKLCEPFTIFYISAWIWSKP